jgi:hypothetical protein
MYRPDNIGNENISETAYLLQIEKNKFKVVTDSDQSNSWTLSSVMGSGSISGVAT